MGLFRRSEKKGPGPQPDDMDAQMLELMRHGDDFASQHGLGHTPDEIARVDQIITDEVQRALTDDQRQQLHRQVTGYLYQTIMTNFPDRWFVMVAPGNPVAMGVGDRDDRVQVLGWQKVAGRIENGDEDNLQFFYEGIVDYAGKPGVQTLM